MIYMRFPYDYWFVTESCYTHLNPFTAKRTSDDFGIQAVKVEACSMDGVVADADARYDNLRTAN
jgi:hypothetical protein